MKFHNPVADDVRSLISSGSPKKVRDSSPRLLHSGQRGIALVITLILLSVTLVMAIAFLAISRRERGSVTTQTDAATAKLAADSALAHAEAQIIANVFATTNPYNFGLLVSTNYINTNGFAGDFLNPTNVNYNYPNGTPLNNADNLFNLANLFYSPRPPVFIVTNAQTGATEFRFYLDLNRNGKFEDTRVDVPDVDNTGFTNTDTIPEVGDPQWIGQLARPDLPHGPNNYFVARYAFIALPAGNTLDLNYIHNQVLNQSLGTADGFSRNQGVGSWEINLAAFLTDLNTNQWDPPTVENFANNPYNYQEWLGSQNTGAGFEDARALLSWRYNYAYNSLVAANNYFTNLANYPYNIDSYGDGPLQTTVDTNFSYFFSTHLNSLWAGADNTNHFFSLPSDLFDSTKSSPQFTNHLGSAGVGNSTYDRYTFYRLLSQLGTDSAAESGKINLNYSNAAAYFDFNGVLTNIVFVPNAETNLVPWTPIQFFTIAADRMLRLYTTNWFQSNPTNYLATYYDIHIPNNYYYTNLDGSILTNDPNGFGLINYLGVPNVLGLTNDTIPAFGITNIPVWVNGNFVYASSVNRLLQLVANVYDATTNRYSSFDLTFPLPTVFKPFFTKVPNGATFDLHINGFTEVTDNSFLANPIQNLNGGFSVIASNQPNDLVFGVPLIIGAKKGLPNFNQFTMQNYFEITRKLELTRAATNSDPSTYKLNQMFTIGGGAQSGIANQLEVECWNSYATSARSTDIYVTNYLTMTLTNDEDFITNAAFVISGFTNVSPWSGYVSGSATSFKIPLNTNVVFVPANSIYRFNSGVPYLTSDPAQSNTYESNVVVNGSSYPQPHWWLFVTNNVQIFMIDHLTGRLIDYVQLSGPNNAQDINAEILGITNYTALWLTNYKSSAIVPTVSFPEGVEAQLIDSERGQDVGWDLKNDAGGFNNFIHNGNDGQLHGETNLAQATYSPPAAIYQATTWQANDPLIHYMAADLFDSANNANALYTAAIANPPITLTFPNERYQPWSRSSQMANKTAPDTSPYNIALKDPLIWSSDHWDFPTNKLPTVGWLGRVHRGTPWQTVYLKASNILKSSGTNVWMNWSGNFNTGDAINAAPLQDRLLFDIFSTALNDNATRGQLSVNVAANPNDSAAGLAAWSAMFSGVMVLNNNTNGLYLTTYHTYHPLLTVPSLTAFPINPAGANGAGSQVWQLVTNINSMRTNFVNLDGANDAFEHVGDILSANQLSEQSPFLNLSGTNQQQYFGISDEMYEWLPQQMMSLLNCPTSPRYVIYCYGQTLKPAQNSLVTGGGQFFGMCTNYQITSEAAVRVVLRVDDANTSHPHAVIESYNLLPPD